MEYIKKTVEKKEEKGTELHWNATKTDFVKVVKEEKSEEEKERDDADKRFKAEQENLEKSKNDRLYKAFSK